MDELTEFVCDYCGEEISVPLDDYARGPQEFVLDCPVCCRPSLVIVEVDEEGRIDIRAERSQD
ncbi:MAG: CPXCG motif-containing cysteine-rich protein [Pirellulaceae bacterium]